MVELRLKACSPIFMLKVEETDALWPEQSARAGTAVTCNDYAKPIRWRHRNVFNIECVIV